MATTWGRWYKGKHKGCTLETPHRHGHQTQVVPVVDFMPAGPRCERCGSDLLMVTGQRVHKSPETCARVKRWKVTEWAGAAP